MALKVIIVWLFIAIGISSVLAQSAGPGDGGVAGNNGGIAGPGPGSSGPIPPPVPVFPLNITTSPLVVGGIAGPNIPTSITQPTCCSWTKNYVISGFTGTTSLSLWRQEDGGGLAGTFISNGSSSGQLEAGVKPQSSGTGLCGTAAIGCIPFSAINDGGRHMVTFTYCSDVTNTLGVIQGYVDGVATGTSAKNNVGYAPSLEPGQLARLSTVSFNIYLFQALNTRCWNAADVAAMYADIQANALPPYNDPLNAGISIYMPMECAAGACASIVSDISGNNNNAYYDTTPPVAAITTPTPAQVVTGNQTLTVVATDVGGSGVNYCQFLIDNSIVGPQIFLTSSPNTYTYVWNSALVIDANHQVSSTCVDRVNNSATSAAVTFSTSNGKNPSVYYWSATVGLDTNDCKSPTNGTPPSGPCKTTGHLNTFALGESDQVLFNATDGSFNGCINLSSTHVTSGFTLPVILGAYNSGQWTLIAPCTGTAGAVESDAVNIVVQDGNIHPATAGQGVVNTAGGIYPHNFTGSSPISVLIQRNTVGDFNALGPGGSISADILLEGFPGITPSAIQPTILNNTLCGATNASSDAAGMGGFGNSLNITNVVLTGNISCNNGGVNDVDVNGFLFAGVNGATASFNLAHDIGWNNFTCGGPYGFITAGAENVTNEFFESYNVKSSSTQTYLLSAACDHGGADIDEGSINVLFQDYYTHNSFGPGTLIFQGFLSGVAWSSNTVRYMVGENDGQITAFGVGGLGGLNFVPNLGIAATGWYYNNTIFNNVASFSSLNPGNTTTATTTGSISGTTLTVASGTGVGIGKLVTGTGVTANTIVMSGSGTSWVVNNSQTVGSTSLSFASATFQTIAAGGTGGTPGLTTFTLSAGGCSTTPPTVQGVINGSGVLTGAVIVLNPGQCITPASTEALAGGSLTGGTISANFTQGNYAGVDIGSASNMTAIIANNIFNTGTQSNSQFGGSPLFIPIKHPFTALTQVNQFLNNTMTTTAGGSPALNIQFDNVTYTSVAAFQAANSGSTGNLTTAPNFAGSPPFGTLTWTPSTATSWPIPTHQPNAYLLSSMGSLNDAGVAPQSSWFGGVPTRDFYNTAVPNGGSGGWSIGASGLQ